MGRNSRGRRASSRRLWVARASGSEGPESAKRPARALHGSRGAGLALCLAVAWVGIGAPVPALAEGEPAASHEAAGRHLTGDWGGARSHLEDRGVILDVAYTGDYVGNTLGGIRTADTFLGNLDMTLTLHTWRFLPVDLGTVFAYGLVNHGGQPTEFVGDLQGTDNIQAPESARLFEIWWQKAFFGGRVSLLGGLYDVNSEFYVVESAEIFLNSSFGIGPEVALSGVNGPSIFPFSSLAFRVKAELFSEWEFSAAVMDGVPGDPKNPTRIGVQFDPGDGVFFIGQISRAWRAGGESESVEVINPARRRRVGRTMDQRPETFRLTLGTWVYSSDIPQLEALARGSSETASGHPGVYLLGELDATDLTILRVPGLAAFVQLGYGDPSINPFTGYTGAGLVYTGLIPMRPIDTFGVGVAAAYIGRGYEALIRSQGNEPAFGEVALEVTYRAYPIRWFSVQADLQYVIHPGAVRNRPDALVAGLRFVVDL